MSTEQAIQLNNQAVSCLERKLFSDAILLSCAALEMFQQYQRMVAQASLEELGRSDSIIDHFMMLGHGPKRSCDDTMNDEFIYEHGIILPIDAALDHSVITSVLIFNCALSHQLVARYCNHDGASRKYLDRAGRLYQLASRLDQDMENTMIFNFAMLNNIGVIHRGLGNYEKSKHCFGDLVSLMMVYVDVGVESQLLQLIRGFWKNVLANEGAMIAPAA